MFERPSSHQDVAALQTTWAKRSCIRAPRVATPGRKPRDDISSVLQTAQQREVESSGHLEECLAAAESVGCSHDWANWLVQYVKLLCKQGDVLRLNELCEGLLGPLSWRRENCAHSGAASRAPSSHTAACCCSAASVSTACCCLFSCSAALGRSRNASCCAGATPAFRVALFASSPVAFTA